MDELEKTIQDIRALHNTTPEILEQIANHAYLKSDLPDEMLDDDNDGADGGFCQLLSSSSLKQYIVDSIDNGDYGNFESGKALCQSAQHGLMISVLIVYREACQRPKALWYLADNDWPDSARLAKPEDVIRCLKTIEHDAKYYAR